MTQRPFARLFAKRRSIRWHILPCSPYPRLWCFFWPAAASTCSSPVTNQANVETLNELVAAGLSISIDDFGTGYSSLSYLKRFPIRTLKIDRSFIRDIIEDQSDAQLVETIMLMAHNLGITVVAEGVETEAQLAWLKSRGCEQILQPSPVSGGLCGVCRGL